MSWRTVNRESPRRVVVTKNLPGSRWREVLTSGGCEICFSTSSEIHSVEEIKEAIGERCDGAIGQLTEPWGAELFEALKQAGGSVYSNYAVGHDNVTVDEASRRGIAVGNTPGVLTETTAEMTVALTFAAARRVTEADSFLRQGRFRGWLPDLFLGKRLYGSTLGIVGAGRIGARYARMMAVGSGLDVVYWDLVENEPLERFFREMASACAVVGEKEVRCRRADELEELLAVCDIVSLHVPLGASTRHLVDGRRLSLMKPDAILVNTSRGPVIDEAALVDHLMTHPDFRVGLDVFENEPALAAGLAELPNAVIVPHIASATVWTRGGMATLAACNVAGILQGFPVVRELDVHEFLEGEFPHKTPSIVNREELGLEVC